LKEGWSSGKETEKTNERARERNEKQREKEKESMREEFPRRPQNSITPCLQLSTLNPLYWIQSVCQCGVSQNLINFMGKGFG